MTNYKSMFSDDIAVRVPSVKVNELALDGFTKAPNTPVPKGRPKVQRIKGFRERVGGEPVAVFPQQTFKKCGRCGKKGHNKATCKVQIL